MPAAIRSLSGDNGNVDIQHHAVFSALVLGTHAMGPKSHGNGRIPHPPINPKKGLTAEEAAAWDEAHLHNFG
eukprot:12759480-Alexandrium_andersonii.AAC.1